MSNHLPTPEEREIENARIIDRCLNPDMLPYDWDSEEAQGTEEELKAESYDVGALYPSVNGFTPAGVLSRA